MEKTFCLGMMAGVTAGIAVGALAVANNRKACSLVKKSGDEVVEKINTMLDEKLSALSQNSSCSCNSQSQNGEKAQTQQDNSGEQAQSNDNAEENSSDSDLTQEN